MFSFHTRKNINFTKDQISLRSRVVRVKNKKKKYIKQHDKSKRTIDFQLSNCALFTSAQYCG